MQIAFLQVEFSPTLKQLATIVGNISGFLTRTISDIRRLPDLLTRKKSTKDVSAITLQSFDILLVDHLDCVLFTSFRALTGVYLMCIFQPIHEVIARDDEVRKTDNLISQGMKTNAQNLQNYLSTWDNYRFVLHHISIIVL